MATICIYIETDGTEEATYDVIDKLLDAGTIQEAILEQAADDDAFETIVGIWTAPAPPESADEPAPSTPTQAAAAEENRP